MKEKLKAFLVRVKTEAIRAEVWIKSALVAAFAGGLNVVHEMYEHGIAFTATAEHYTLLKAKFIAGSVTGLVAYFMKQPWSKPQQ